MSGHREKGLTFRVKEWRKIGKGVTIRAIERTSGERADNPRERVEINRKRVDNPGN
ncbi:hypothetical protein [Sporosarcina sp. G11-34]|uniref:hypothetical protein n=1 Tax=Sporosarcina sp. G11-34 TaxID=2849605 RepID=UPI0022A8D983|nr:hypothetical protein [Sporosarcina sp. G11-34]MCZ2257418.1 hypothetical protein [Sporosarcina sp. G11-34]